MPSKLIIILDRPAGGRFNYALWADVPLARQPFYAQVGQVSAWTGASAAENTAIAAGQVVERIEGLPLDGQTLPQVQAFLIQRQLDFQAEINAVNTWTRYGTFYKDAAWTLGGA